MGVTLNRIAHQREAKIDNSVDSLAVGTSPAMDEFLGTADTGYFPGLK